MPKKSTASGDAIEKDAGYGESHGYSQSHGGPTGPGDAPAKPAPTTTPKPDAKAPTAGDAIDLDGRDSRRSAVAEKKKSSLPSKKGGPRVDRSRSH